MINKRGIAYSVTNGLHHKQVGTLTVSSQTPCVGGKLITIYDVPPADVPPKQKEKNEIINLHITNAKLHKSIK